MITKILNKLNRYKVKYLVVGGVAVNLYGFYRATEDLDIILLLEDSNLKKFAKAIKSLKLVPRVPVKIEDFANADLRRIWIKDKNMKAFTLYEPNFQRKYLDVIIDHPINFKQAYKKRKTFRDGELVAQVISMEDLIKMKKNTARERDKMDLKGLKQIKDIRNDTE